MAGDYDFSDVSKLAADLGRVPDNAGPFLRQAITGTSMGVKKAWQQPLKGSATLPGLVSALSFDIKSDGKSIESEIGFDLGRGQGPLGGISEFGSPTIAGRGYGLKALEDNQADFVKGIEAALDDALKKGGL
jgi:hypothetical protein